MTERLRIGTRGSQLALRQAEMVTALLREASPEVPVEIIPIKTSGDQWKDVSLSDLGGKGLFVREIEEALLDGRIDIAVHSLKDLPAALPSGLEIIAFPPREDPSDVLLARTGTDLESLPLGARVGTSSLRRRAQLLSLRPDIQIEAIRGNLDTRISKLRELPLDAIVVAAAGLKRLGLHPEPCYRFTPEEFVPAIGQGILAVETRRDDRRVGGLLSPFDHAPTRRAALAERSFLVAIGGDCHAPLGGHAEERDEALHVTGLVGSHDGKKLLKEEVVGPSSEPEALGRRLAEVLLALGALKLMRDGA
jgi:hydroxymethylbilane synthase